MREKREIVNCGHHREARWVAYLPGGCEPSTPHLVRPAERRAATSVITLLAMNEAILKYMYLLMYVDKCIYK